jgi:AcrR family transcriptional regulator
LPAPAKVSDEQVVAAARRLVEEHGVAALSMQAVAERVGVRAPSLYKRFRDRADLLAAVEREVLEELEGTLEDAVAKARGKEELVVMARAYRRFAHAHPRLYALIFAPEAPTTEAATELRRRAARPLTDRLASRLGPARALPAARVLTAYLHGFVTMELQGAFRLGGDVAAAFELGLDVLARSLAEPTAAKKRGPPA